MFMTTIVTIQIIGSYLSKSLALLLDSLHLLCDCFGLLVFYICIKHSKLHP
jgi:Co/Zn/Cd efflux system component